jgi:hypothetical protein
LQLDLYVIPEGVRDRTDLLGFADGVFEVFLADAEHRATHVEVYARDLELLVVQGTYGIYLEPLRRRVILGKVLNSAIA